MIRLLASISLIIVVFACNKDDAEMPDNAIRLSTSFIDFDTLFTTTGSITRLFKIYNQSRKGLHIGRISLRRGQQSFFSLNADGRPGQEVIDVEVGGDDSVYVFVSVNIDPSDADLPFLISDTIDIEYNQQKTSVSLEAWGQNAWFLRSQIIIGDTTWNNERPIVILGGLLVSEDATLRIEAGTQVYVHADAPIIIDGSISAAGDHYDSTRIRFRGDRLDQYYRDLPASWPGIYFSSSSSGNLLEYVDVLNAYQGIVSDGGDNATIPKIQLRQCRIDNCYDAGIIGINTSIAASNCLVTNCGRNVLLVQGGNYEFTHCTLAAFGNVYIPHKQPVLTISDYLKQGDVVSFGKMTAEFVNCIIWGGGGVDDEAALIREGTEPYSVNLSSCLWKIASRPVHAQANDMIENEDPLFVDVTGSQERHDFRLKAGSPAIDRGAPTGLSWDFDGKQRSGIPDVGAFESTF
jgi:hypothetical protein